MITFVVEGPPIPWARARRDGNRYFIDDAQRTARAALAWAAKPLVPGPQPGPFLLDVRVYLPMPERWKAPSREAGERGAVRPIGQRRNDGDNFLKLVADALNGVVWIDDGQIVDARVRKFYSDNPRTEVRIAPVGGPEAA